ncbi:MAG: hypothetical protein PVI97_16710 [Candidatus Thiodiazotropha sp.]
MNVETFIDSLNSLLAILEEDIDYNGELNILLKGAAGNIPISVCNLFKKAKTVNNVFSFAFLGYLVLEEKDIIQDLMPEDEKSFWGAYQYDGELVLTEDMQINLEDNLDGELDESVPINYVGNLLPISKFQGDYLVIDLSKDRFGYLLAIVNGHIASILAPSIIDHVKDLIEGLKEQCYKVIDDEIIYPTAWYLRKMLRAGKIEIDEFGEVIS